MVSIPSCPVLHSGKKAKYFGPYLFAVGENADMLSMPFTVHGFPLFTINRRNLVWASQKNPKCASVVHQFLFSLNCKAEVKSSNISSTGVQLLNPKVELLYISPTSNRSKNKRTNSNLCVNNAFMFELNWGGTENKSKLQVYLIPLASWFMPSLDQT